MSVLVLHETMLWKKERSRIRAVQRDNLGGLLAVWRLDRVPNARIRELCRTMNRLMVFSVGLVM